MPWGFSVGIDSTKARLSEIIYTFLTPLACRRENGAKNLPKLILAKIEIKFNYFPMFKGLYISS